MVLPKNIFYVKTELRIYQNGVCMTTVTAKLMKG